MELHYGLLDQMGQAIESRGLKRSAFIITGSDVGVELDLHTIVSFQYSNSPFFFKVHDFPISEYEEERRITSNPGIDGKEHYFNYVESNLSRLFNDWLSYLKRDLKHKHSWESFFSPGITFNVSLNPDIDLSNSYSSSEIEVLQEGLNTLKVEISKLAFLVKHQISIANEHLDQLFEQIKKSNKFDWKSQLIATGTAIIIALTLDTSSGRVIWQLIENWVSVIPGMLLIGN